MFLKNKDGRMVIRLSDTTTHGGQVITGCDIWTVDGRPVARVGDMVMCPQCNNQAYPIVQGDATITQEGRPIAFEGHLTACGARLISSLNQGAVSYANTVAATSTTASLSQAPVSNASQSSSDKLNDQGVLPSTLLRIDEQAILTRYREAIRFMVSHDMRYKGHGWANARWNNLNSEEWFGQYRRCYPQSQLVADWLNDLDLHYEWTFYIVGDMSGIWDKLTDTEHHYWIEAVAPIGSSVIKLDPLYDEVSFLDSPSSSGNSDMTPRITGKDTPESGINDPERFISAQKLWRYSIDN